MQTNIKFNLQPKQRPKLADEIAAALHTLPCYQKVPSLSYKIGDCTLERDGTLRIPDTVDSETVDRLLNHLQEKGFTGEIEQTEDRLIITVPNNTFTEQALANLIVNGESLYNWSHDYRPAVDNPVVAEITKGHRLLPGSRTRHELRYHDRVSENGIAVVVPQIVAVFILELAECHSRLVIHEPYTFLRYSASTEKYRLIRSS